MNSDTSLFLAHRLPQATESVDWGEHMLLRAMAYLSSDVPPLSTVTSVRAVILRADTVLVQQDRDSRHILPGGRREGTESLETTLHREVGEETGWALRNVHPLGFIHFEHLDPKQASYAYPYPHFFQRVYGSEAVAYARERMLDDGYEVGSAFLTISDIDEYTLKPIERVFLRAALRTRGA